MTEYNDNSGKKIGAWIVGGVVLIAVGAAALYLVDLDQTKEARLPEVEVSTEGGQMPAFDVEVADVDVGTEEKTVTVPGVDVETKTIEVEVPVGADMEDEEVVVDMPTIDIEKPEENSPDNDPN